MNNLELKVEEKDEKVEQLALEEKVEESKIEESLNYDSLSQKEKDAIEEFNKKIDINDSTQILQFGASAQDKISKFSDSILEDVKTKNTGEVFSNGEHIKLVNGYQARNNRRVVVLGSTEICSDKFYYLSMSQENKSMLDSPNAVFCKDILNWNFQKTGVLKFTNVRHNNNQGQTLDTYRIKDYLEYYIDILEYDHTTDTWKNYDVDDIQLSFIMMNPYYINQMKRIYGKPTYYAKFRAPEKHGVFKFIVDYHRTGYSYIFSSTKIPLRPFYHNEFPRFIPCAYPYYVSVFVILGSFILFSILFLYGKEKEKTE